MDEQESVAQRIAREKREANASETDATKTESLSEHQREIAKGRSAADLGDPDKGTKEDNKVSTDVEPKVDVQPTLVADGSRSPHDKSSDGGNRQEAAHAQVRAAQAGGPGSLVGATQRAAPQVVEGNS